MDDADRLARDFEAHRTHLRAVAYRMLGSTGEGEDAVQEAWIRLGRAGGEGIDDLRGWLTTVVARVCIDGLRVRASRPEESLEALAERGTGRLPDPLVVAGDPAGPEERALLADGVGLGCWSSSTRSHRRSVSRSWLHDLFAVSFERRSRRSSTGHRRPRRRAARPRRSGRAAWAVAVTRTARPPAAPGGDRR